MLYSHIWTSDSICLIGELKHHYHSLVRCGKEIYKFLKFFIYLFWERERERTSEEGQKERERIPGRLHTATTEPSVGLELTNHEIMTWDEIKSRSLNWLSHPGTLENFKVDIQLAESLPTLATQVSVNFSTFAYMPSVPLSNSVWTNEMIIIIIFVYLQAGRDEGLVTHWVPQTLVLEAQDSASRCLC